jgi:hypothetical protein
MLFDDPIDEEEPARRSWGWLVVGVALLALLFLGATRRLGFAAPAAGVTQGEPAPGGGELPRDRARVVVEAAMAKPGERPTLADVVRFYGLEEEAVACTVAEAHGLAANDRRIAALARRPLRVGETVTICLD